MKCRWDALSVDLKNDMTSTSLPHRLMFAVILTINHNLIYIEQFACAIEPHLVASSALTHTVQKILRLVVCVVNMFCWGWLGLSIYADCFFPLGARPEFHYQVTKLQSSGLNVHISSKQAEFFFF